MIREKTALKYAKALKEYCKIGQIGCLDCPFYDYWHEVCRLNRTPYWWDIPEEEGEAE